MKTRQEIKRIGQDRFTQNYWPCVCAILLVVLAIGAISAAAAFLPAVGVIVIYLFVGPFTIGLNFFFIQNFIGRAEEIGVGTPFTEAFANYGRKLGRYLWMQLFVFLWSLLLYIPGLIKSLSYAMAPYILADCPEVRATDALKLSMRIMDGRKWDLFVFRLSYLGWQFLSLLTFGILNLFFVEPYRQSASAGWYLEAREDALRRGTITVGQLEGTEAI